MNFWLDNLMQDVTEKYNYAQVATNVFVNTCYYGIMDSPIEEPPRAGFQFVRENLEKMTQEFLVNSITGIFTQWQELVLFLIHFKRYEQDEFQKISLATQDVSQMSGLFTEYNLLYGSSNRLTFPADQTDVLPRDKAQMYLQMIFDDLEERLKNSPQENSQTECMKFFGSRFYTQLLSTIREIVTPGNFNTKFVSDKVIETNKNLTFSLFSTMESPRAEDNAVRPLDYGGEEFKSLQEKYEVIPNEALALRTDVNEMLILAGMHTQIFIDLLKNEDQNRTLPDQKRQEVFGKLDRKCQNLNLVEAHHFEASRLPTSILNFIGGVVLKTIQTEEPTTELSMGSEPVDRPIVRFEEDYRTHDMFSGRGVNVITTEGKFPWWILIIIVIVLVFLFV
jgi:hypothetical protein